MSKILVVDDSPTARAFMVDTLAGTGHLILTAVDGEEALRKASTERPDLILLDVVMPGKNGFHVCRQLKAEATTQGIKIILVTSKNQQSDRMWGLKQGADAYLAKPFDTAELLVTIAKCL
jgi:twitching motility two-component system response regulator PilH